jgi:DtxR family Mn-dependent transcriptional regulator
MALCDYPIAFHEYIEAIYRLSEGNPERLVTNLTIATEMHVKPPSVTEMLGKLQNNGLVRWEKRRGVTLTPSGLDVARQINRNNFVLKTLFNKLFGIKDNAVLEQLACEIEHYLTPKVTKSIEEAIGIENGFDNVLGDALALNDMNGAEEES